MKHIGISLALAGAASHAMAHDTWLAATTRAVQPGAALFFDITSAEHFPRPGTSIAPERIDQAACRQAGATTALQTGERGKAALRLSLPNPGPAAATCWVLLKPRTLDMSPGKVAEYLDEIDAPPSVRQAWQSGARRWHETYTKNAKAMVPGAARDAAGQVPVGLKLEFVLQTAAAGSPPELAALVLRDGKPLAGLSVALSGESGGAPRRVRSDAAGLVRFPAPAAGRWMLSATDLRPVNAADGVWDSQFSTLVFDVPAGR
ncbi:MAG: DUF4198 domain-containing protein [Ramlibacter sp.]